MPEKPDIIVQIELKLGFPPILNRLAKFIFPWRFKESVRVGNGEPVVPVDKFFLLCTLGNLQSGFNCVEEHLINTIIGLQLC